MNRRMKFSFLVAALSLAAVFALACNVKDEINDAGAETKDFDEDFDNLPVIGVGGVCSPAIMTFNDLMSSVSWWEDAKDHLDDVTIEELDYKVTSNESTAQITVYLSLTDTTDVNQVTDDDFLASTTAIAAGTNVPDWTMLEVKPGAEKRMEELITEPDTEFNICARIPEVAAGTVAATDVHLTLGLKISGTATFVPIGD
jgi:hypothetical protein